MSVALLLTGAALGYKSSRPDHEGSSIRATLFFCHLEPSRKIPSASREVQLWERPFEFPQGKLPWRRGRLTPAKVAAFAVDLPNSKERPVRAPGLTRF